MPKYQVTLTYLITVDASDEDGAELMAVSEVSYDPTCFNDCEIEIVDSVAASELYEKRMLDNLVNYTCHLCKDKNKCKYAFDDYCTDGDCLMEK